MNKRDLMKFLFPCLLVGAFSMTIVSCSDDDVSDDYTFSGEFTPGGKYSTKSGSVYLSSIKWSSYEYYLFEYTDGELSYADVCDLDGDGESWESMSVTHDPLQFTGYNGIGTFQLTDIEQNSDGFITSLTFVNDHKERTYSFSYDSSGHLTNFVSSTDVEWTLTWSSDKITEITKVSGGETITLSSFEYSSKYPNVTLQYAPYVEHITSYIIGGEGFPMLFYLGYLGKASSYHPISFTYTYTSTDESDSYEMVISNKPTLNSNGSLKKVKETVEGSSVTYTFSYE